MATRVRFGVAGCKWGQVKWNRQIGAGAEPFHGAHRVGRSSVLGSAHAQAHGAGCTRAACTEREDFCCLGRKICCEILFTRCLCASWPQAASETRVGLHLAMGRGRSNTPPRTGMPRARALGSPTSRVSVFPVKIERLECLLVKMWLVWMGHERSKAHAAPSLALSRDLCGSHPWTRDGS